MYKIQYVYFKGRCLSHSVFRDFVILIKRRRLCVANLIIILKKWGATKNTVQITMFIIRRETLNSENINRISISVEREALLKYES